MGTSTVSVDIFLRYIFSLILHRALDARKLDESGKKVIIGLTVMCATI